MDKKKNLLHMPQIKTTRIPAESQLSQGKGGSATVHRAATDQICTLCNTVRSASLGPCYKSSTVIATAERQTIHLCAEIIVQHLLVVFILLRNQRQLGVLSIPRRPEQFE